MNCKYLSNFKNYFYNLEQCFWSIASIIYWWSRTLERYLIPNVMIRAFTSSLKTPHQCFCCQQYKTSLWPLTVQMESWYLWILDSMGWNQLWSQWVVKSRERLLQGLFRAEWALCGCRTAITLESVATGERHWALLSTSYTALSLLPVHHLE